MNTTIAAYIDLGTAFGNAKAEGSTPLAKALFEEYLDAKNGEWGFEDRDKASEAFYAASARVQGNNIVDLAKRRVTK